MELSQAPSWRFVRVLAYCVLVSGCASPEADHRFSSSGELQLVDGTRLRVDVRYELRRPGFEIPKLISVGSSGQLWELKFQRNGLLYEWRGSLPPMLLQEHEGSMYVVSINENETTHFLFHKANVGKWQAISANDFPRSVALQNLRIVSPASKPHEPLSFTQPLNVSTIEFRRSLTARLWAQLSGDVSSVTDHALLHSYCQRHIPRCPS
jgi:hypothetical protein